MLNTVKLLLPALIPSWRFFSVIAPSPRIEIAMLKTAQDAQCDWQEFRPRPDAVSVGTMLKRMFYNARWNETLFLMSCAERYTKNPNEHSRGEILARIKTELKEDGDGQSDKPFLQFRLVFVYRNGAQLEKQVTYLSPIYRL